MVHKKVNRAIFIVSCLVYLWIIHEICFNFATDERVRPFRLVYLVCFLVFLFVCFNVISINIKCFRKNIIFSLMQFIMIPLKRFYEIFVIFLQKMKKMFDTNWMLNTQNKYVMLFTEKYSKNSQKIRNIMLQTKALIFDVIFRSLNFIKMYQYLLWKKIHRVCYF